jgi:hypothetical protein
MPESHDLLRRGVVAEGDSKLRAHYHNERKHPGLIKPTHQSQAGHLGSAGEIQRRQRLGGMWNYYYGASA